ncbi:cytochrome P450 [Nocardia sp. CA-084685]|uniref:cytochrome P450 n=1 Tax=Nocardia sp. CA-084685 TaxID=3239970 RepID=UPI003D997C4C
MIDSQDIPEAQLDEEIGGLSSHTTTPKRALELFDAARSRCPVAHSDEHGGFHILLEYDVVKRGTSDHKLFSSEPQVLRPILPRNSFAALEMDEPRHKEWRVLFDQAVTPHIVSVLEPLVRADINKRIDGFIERGTADLVEELAETIPADAICRLVGIEDELVPEVRNRAAAMLGAQGDPAEFNRRRAEFAEITLAQVHDRKTTPRDDYLTYLSNIEVEGRSLEDDDYVALFTGFLGAGHHTTTSAMSSLIHDVFSDNDIRARIAADPKRLIPIAVEESLRLRPPFFGFFRRATADTQLAGVDIREGSDVYLGWASANRDPAVFANPCEFRLDRGRNRHLTFGSGVHTCPGASLARMELRVLLEEVLRRLPDLSLEIAEADYEFSGGDYVHMGRLPVRFTPGTVEGN